MAISEDRLGISQLTKIAKSNYANTSDTSDISTKSLSETTPVVKSSILGSLTKKNNSTVNESLSIFEDVLCNGFKPLNLRLPNLKLSLFRDLNFDFGINVCGKSKIINPIDTAFNLAKPLMARKPLLTVAKEGLLNNIIKADTKSSMKALGLGNNIPDCLLNGTKGQLVNSTDLLGNSLKSKLNLLNLLNNNNCGSSIINKTGVNQTVATLSVASVLGALTNSDMNTATNYVTSMLSIDSNRETVLSGTSKTLNTKNDSSIDKKLLLVSTMYDNDTDMKRKDRESIYVRTDSTIVLQNLDKTNNTSNSPVSDGIILTKSLDTIDPNWSRDSEGNTNMYKVSNNSRLNDISTKTMASRQPMVNNTGSTNSTSIDPFGQIAILNSFNKSKSIVV